MSNHHWHPPRGLHAAQSVVPRVQSTRAVAALVGVSSQRVTQLEHQAVRKLWQRRARELLRGMG